MPGETVFILLFVVATAVAIAVQRLAVPYTVALVVTGLVLGVLQAFEAPHLTKDLLFNIFLPGLLFEAAFHIDFAQLWRNRGAVSALALPGVVAAIALTAILLTPIANTLHFVQGFTWTHALVFGALISATDPIAVVAIFKHLGVPKRLSVLLDGESLLNDGVAIVFFTLSLALVTGTRITTAGLALDFVKIAGLGALVGSGIGLGISQIIKQVNEPMIEITLTTIAAYGSFLTAEHFHFSGVIATVAAGLVCGNYAAAGRHGALHPNRGGDILGLYRVRLEFHRVPFDWFGSAVPDVAGRLAGDPGGLSGRYGRPGAGHFRRVAAVAEHARTNSMVLECGFDLGWPAWRPAHGAGAELAQRFLEF